jgi:hypothetical protein
MMLMRPMIRPLALAASVAFLALAAAASAGAVTIPSSATQQAAVFDGSAPKVDNVYYWHGGWGHHWGWGHHEGWHGRGGWCYWHPRAC